MRRRSQGPRGVRKSPIVASVGLGGGWMRGDNRGWKEREEKEEEEECVIDWLVPNAQRRKEKMWRGRADGYICIGDGQGRAPVSYNLFLAFICVHCVSCFIEGVLLVAVKWVGIAFILTSLSVPPILFSPLSSSSSSLHLVARFCTLPVAVSSYLSRRRRRREGGGGRRRGGGRGRNWPRPFLRLRLLRT